MAEWFKAAVLKKPGLIGVIGSIVSLVSASITIYRALEPPSFPFKDVRSIVAPQQ
jgi:hypothetical protein